MASSEDYKKLTLEWLDKRVAYEMPDDEYERYADGLEAIWNELSDADHDHINEWVKPISKDFVKRLNEVGRKEK